MRHMLLIAAQDCHVASPKTDQPMFGSANAVSYSTVDEADKAASLTGSRSW